MPKRHTLLAAPVADARLTDRRSQSEVVHGGPVLKLACQAREPTTDDASQVIEAANDTAESAVRLPEPCILYRGAPHKSDPAPEALGSPPAASSADPVGGLSAMPGGEGARFRPSSRGGARNRADRRTTVLTERQARNLMEAVALAETLGLPLSRFTTIHWERAGVINEVRATTALLKSLGEHARRRRYPLAYVWTRENGPQKGGHLHLLWHGPVDWPDLERCLRRAMKAAGAVNRKGVRRTLSVGRSLRAAVASRPEYLANLTTVQGYILKGGSVEALDTLGLDRAEPGGVVVGKRCGVSENLGPTARRQF